MADERMPAPRLSKRRLEAIIDALNAGLAGGGEGDFADVPTADLEGALDWAHHRLSRWGLKGKLKQARQRDIVDAARQFAADKERYFPQPQDQPA